jgi:hypothetical protein
MKKKTDYSNYPASEDIYNKLKKEFDIDPRKLSKLKRSKSGMKKTSMKTNQEVI